MLFLVSGSTPKGTIPLFWEHSYKSGIVLVGVLPELLKTETGSSIDQIYKSNMLSPTEPK